MSVVHASLLYPPPMSKPKPLALLPDEFHAWMLEEMGFAFETVPHGRYLHTQYGIGIDASRLRGYISEGMTLDGLKEAIVVMLPEDWRSA